MTAVQEVLQSLLLEGRVVTVDALLTQREIAQTIVAKKALPDAGEGQPTGFTG